MKKYTYRLDGEDEILVAEEHFNAQGQTILEREIEKRKTITDIHEFNSANLLIRTSNYENDLLLDVAEFDYNEQGEVIEQRLIIQEELYERIVTRFNATGFTRTTYQEGEEIEKVIHAGDKRTYKSHYYSYGELDQYQVATYNSRERELTVLYYSAQDELLTTLVESFDRQDRTIARTQTNADGQLISEEAFEYGGNLLVQSKTQDFWETHNSELVLFEHDGAGRIIHTEVRNLEGKLRDFHKLSYNEKGWCIEEVIVKGGDFDVVSGANSLPQNIHMVHRYED